MASTSSSAPITHYKYDVFLSFRGEDTRHSFTDHLYEALRRSGITAFRDDDEIREGQELKPEIERSIKESRGSVIVFSENFAKSRWCLDELWLILEQKRKVGHFVLPVFYKVDPSDVRNQRGSYSLEAKEEGTKWTQDNVNRWKAALTEVANLKGMVVSGYETIIIPNIIKNISSELSLKIPITPTSLTGIKTRAKSINSWLNNKKLASPVLAICGMGGGGKTTLAEYIYNSNKQNFERCSLLKNIEKHHDGLLGVQKQLLSDISGNNMVISDEYDGALKLMNAIQMNKVLIVVDDIDDKDTLSTIFGTKVFPTQSKIIITTRIQNIDGWYGSISCGCRVHKVELLNEIESLELLSFHAFGSKFPLEGFKKLALRLAKYCGGNPLALKVLGSSLSVRAQDQWQRNNMIEIWRSRMNALNSSKGDLDCKIKVVLKRSYESLADLHRELFLHIACFFVDEYKAKVEMILGNDYQAKFGIMTLINRCLVTVERRRLVMHKLLQDMAREIVREESKDPAKRSRVWQSDESYHLLSKGDGSETIEGLKLNVAKAKQGMKSATFKTSSLVKMKNLKLLQLEGVKLAGSYENFPYLIWLRWFKCNLKTIPPGVLMSSLVTIEMRYGDLEKFEPPMGLNSLKLLDLSYSYKLVSIWNLHRLPKLEKLLLQQCTSLTHVCKTIGDLENLSLLALSGCTGLWKALSNQKCVNQLERLKALCICGGIPEQPLFALPQSLSKLYIHSNPFEILPSYIDLKMIQTLCLSSCPNLKSLSCLPSTLKRLHVEWCTSLERITFQSARFTLQQFSYEGCFKLFEIEGLFKLQSIGKLEAADLGHMQWIKSYQNHKVDLVGDVITKGRTSNIQMLYEYGIRSTYLQGIKDQSMETHEYISSSSWFLSFRVPLQPKKHIIQGLNVTILYRSLGEERNTEPPPLFARISNKSKGVTWVYSPVVFCKPRVDEDVTWLSYWPIGNSLDVGDEIYVDILSKEGTISRSGYGASLVYMDAEEVEKEEKSEEEVIGGDLSRFKVTKGGYYLCRKNFYNSVIPDCFFDERIQITDLRRWRRGAAVTSLFESLNRFRNTNRDKYKVTLGVNFESESEIEKIEKAVYRVEGVESVSIQKEASTLTVCGAFDFEAVVTCVRQYEKMVQILTWFRLSPAQEARKEGKWIKLKEMKSHIMILFIIIFLIAQKFV